MCGRFVIIPTEAEIASWFDAVLSNNLPPSPRYNVAPTQQVVAVAMHETQRYLVSFRWGFLRHWYKSASDRPLLINARSETITTKPAFRAAFKSRRCLLPASGFYEWTKGADGGRDPWYIEGKDGSLLALAGIWQKWGRGEDRTIACSIVTTAANDDISKIHRRMPVAVPASLHDDWLCGSINSASAALEASRNMSFRFRRVSRRVNAFKSQGPQLIEELTNAQSL